MTNPDQDVTLDEMVKETVKWIPDDKMQWKENRNSRNGVLISEWIALSVELADKLNVSTRQIRPERVSRSLDVIREVEEAIKDRIGWKKYIDCLVEDGRMFYTEHPNLALWWGLQADPETRLRAIYKTLKEAGEV